MRYLIKRTIQQRQSDIKKGMYKDIRKTEGRIRIARSTEIDECIHSEGIGFSRKQQRQRRQRQRRQTT